MNVNLLTVEGAVALISAIATGVGGTYITLKKFKWDRTKGQIDVEASLRNELRAENEKLRKEMETLREQVQNLFQANLDLRTENNSLNMKIDSLEDQVQKLVKTANVTSNRRKEKREKRKGQ